MLVICVCVHGQGEEAKTVSVITFGKDPYAVAALELLRIGKLPNQAALEADANLNLEALLAKENLAL